MVGLGTGSSGGVTVADMDHVERSNLSRQFLFRLQDIYVSACPSHPTSGLCSSNVPCPPASSCFLLRGPRQRWLQRPLTASTQTCR